MSIKYGTTDVSDVKINQNGTLVQVNKIVKDGVTLWQKNGRTTGGVWRGYYNDEYIIMDWDDSLTLWLSENEWLSYNDVSKEWIFADIALDFIHIPGNGSDKELSGFGLEITWSAT